MTNGFLKNNFGFTLVGLMVSVAITAIVALGAAYVIESAQNVNSFGTTQNEIDRLQYLNLQLSRNPAFILKQPGFEKTGPLYQCLQHSGPVGVDCRQVRAPASYVNTTKITGSAGSVVSTMSFQPNCQLPQACESLTITTSTSMQQSTQGSSKLSSTLSFQPRRSVSIIPSYLLVPVTGFNFSCVQNQGMVMGLNYADSQAVCQPLAGTLADVAEPLANFGPLTATTTQNMTNQNCGANGFSSIGSFQDQTGCMIPSVTTTTLMVAPSPMTTMPPSATPTIPPTPTTQPSCQVLVKTLMPGCVAMGKPSINGSPPLPPPTFCGGACFVWECKDARSCKNGGGLPNY